ncbi:hypothetical protein GCM10009613_43880 [Pseudonocardia kongjuensis]|uniref:Helix-turn-helix domain-containing protein n=2 Tax=Pseudonocardia kongjuensis TaxID=102227 RepID=A0ABN1Y368_9PSEU
MTGVAPSPPAGVRTARPAGILGPVETQAGLSGARLPIDAAARLLGTTVSALRHYDDRGLVRPAGRAGGRRWYGRAELRELALLRAARDTGLPLEGIAALLDPDRRDTIADRLAELDRLGARAAIVRTVLAHVRDCPAANPWRDCPALTGALDALLDGAPLPDLGGSHPGPAADTDGRHEVAVLVRPGVLPMELGLVHQLLGGARSAAGDPLYRVRTCAPVPGTVRTDGDFAIVVDHGPEILAGAGTVVVLAAHAPHDEDPDVLDGGLGAALASIGPDTRIVSICTAAFALARAGLLDGRRATTHWLSAERLRSRFPQVQVEPDVLYVDEGRILTAAGEASGIDLCLHLIRRDFGAAVANEVARRTVVPPYREGGQAQYVARPVTPERTGTGTAGLREWMLDRLDRPLSLDELAARLHVSVRTLTRRFRAETGLSPLEWLLRQRVERARELLELGDLSIERIADRCGFGTATALRRHFAAQLGVPPAAYRRTFCGS